MAKAEEIAGIASRLGPILSDTQGAAVTIDGIEPLAGGACQDNFRVNFTVEGAGPRKMALRSDARSSLPGSLRRRDEARVIQAAVKAGVLTPRISALIPDLLRPGADAYLLDWVEGVAVGRQVLRSPELEGARRVLPEALAKELTKIHAITPRSAPELLVEGLGPAEDPSQRALRVLRGSIDAQVERRPAMELIYRWLVEHRPPPSEPVLVHGDFRTGNFMVTPSGLAAVLDWEFARWGAPEEDLSWISVRDWRFGQIDRPIGGFSDRATFYRAYQAARGVSVDRDRVAYWEIAGNASWACGSVAQTERYLSGEERDLELLSIGPRAVEMEWEALRLIEEQSR